MRVRTFPLSHPRFARRLALVAPRLATFMFAHLLRRQLNPLPNNILKLSHSQITRDQVLLLVDIGDRGRAVRALADYGNAIGVLGAYARSLRLAFLEGCGGWVLKGLIIRRKIGEEFFGS